MIKRFLIFCLSLKDRFHSYGKEIFATTKGLLRILRESVSSLKEAKIAGVEPHFTGTYGKLRDYAANLIVTVAILYVLPRAASYRGMLATGPMCIRTTTAPNAPSLA